jgi:monofunctional biosynthetic peptidoglycan transglycosylase
MGGRSVSELRRQGENLVFRGDVSLRNNGGFASVRFALQHEFSQSDEVVLKIKGDGKRYELRFRVPGQWQAVSYAQSFETVKDEWIEVKLLEQDFNAVWRGYAVRDAPALQLEDAAELSIFIADKQVGDFQIELESIRFN